MKTIGSAALLLAVTGGAAQAQATRMYMPEGTYDMVFGVAAQTTLGRKGGNRSVVVPALDVQWSNGVFIDVNVREAVLGVHLSDHPNFYYGLQAAVSGREQRDDTPGQRGGVATQAGAFMSWRALHNVGISGFLMAGGGFNGGGLLGLVQARYWMRLAAHHGASLTTGAYLADHSWQQGYFGVTEAQAANGGNPAYRARAGVVNYFGDVQWQWEMGNKYALYTGLRVNRLGSSPAGSPLVGERGRISLRTALTYHF